MSVSQKLFGNGQRDDFHYAPQDVKHRGDDHAEKQKQKRIVEIELLLGHSRRAAPRSAGFINSQAATECTRGFKTG